MRGQAGEGGTGGYFFVHCGKFGSPYLAKAQQLQEQRYPFLSLCVYSIAVCPNNGIYVFVSLCVYSIAVCPNNGIYVFLSLCVYSIAVCPNNGIYVWLPVFGIFSEPVWPSGKALGW